MNKKIKKILLTLLTIITFTSFNNEVKAELYNGQGGTNVTQGVGSCSNKKNCLYNNGKMGIVKISLWYYDGTNFEQVGRHFYYVNSEAYTFLNNGQAYKGTNGEQIIFKLDPGSDGKSKLDACDNSTTKYKCISNKIRDYYGETGEYSIKVTDNSKIDINWMLSSPTSSDKSDYYKDFLTKESQPTNKTNAATYGYRIFIEPVINITNITYEDGTTTAGYGIFTVKDAVQKLDLSGNHESELAQLLFTQWKDVGISAGVKNPPDDTSNDYCKNITLDQFKDTYNGCGYNILDLSNFAAKPKCYIKSVSGNVKCSNTDRNNIGKFKETYKKDTCPDSSDSSDLTNTEDGKLMVETAACNVYCKESAEVSFPGNMSRKKAISLIPTEGSYFAWPTRRYDPTGIYPMSMQSKMNCTIVEKTTGCDKEQVKKKVKDKFDSLNYGAKLEAGTNQKINGSLVIDEKEIKSGSNDETNTFYYKKTVYFKIDSTKNRCYNIQDQKVRDCEKAFTNEFDRRQGVISLSEDDPSDIRYTLSLSDVKLGTDNQFGKLIGTYTCYYRIAAPDEPCKCPAGTLREGEDLYEQVTKDKTCAELQETECDYCTCPKDSLYPDEILDVGTEVCDSKKMEHCYNSCETKDGTKINITDCTKREMNNGYSIGEAAYKCVLNTPECDWKYKTCTYHGNLSDLDEVTKEICDLNNVTTQENSTNNNDITDNINGYKDKENNKFDNFDNHNQQINEEQNNNNNSNNNNSNNNFVTQQVNLAKCLEMGFSVTTCKSICCPKSVCVGEDCYTCTEDCKWEMQGTIKKDSTMIKYIRKCEDDEICDKIVLACPGGDEKMKNPMSCLQKELNGVTNIQEALNTGRITPSDVERAFKACQEEVCPGTNQKILYRVIDLDNPFPGKNNEGTLTEFSNIGKGRKPGSNWNSVTTVKNKILNARGARGYKLYEQEPLYVITLTPSSMKEIREYNKETKYSNFDMNCTNTNETGKCISNFLHKNYSDIVTGGKCKSIKDSATFDTCYSDTQ